MRVQLPVHVLIVKHTHGVRARRQVSEHHFCRERLRIDQDLVIVKRLRLIVGKSFRIIEEQDVNAAFGVSETRNLHGEYGASGPLSRGGTGL